MRYRAVSIILCFVSIVIIFFRRVSLLSPQNNMGNSESQSLDPSASHQLEQYANVPISLSQSLSETSEASNDGSCKLLPLPITTNNSLSNNPLPDIIVSPSSLTKNSSKLFDANGNNYAEQQKKRVTSTCSNQQRPTTLPLHQYPLSPSDIMEDVNFMLQNMALLTKNTSNSTAENITENDANIDDDVRPYSEDIFAGLHALLRDVLAPLPPGAPNRMHVPYNSVADYQRVMLPLIRYDYFAALHQGIRNLADQLSSQEFNADNTGQPQLVSNAWYWVYNNKRIVLRTQHKIRFVVQLSLEERPKNFNKMQAESTTMTTTTLAKNPFSDKKYQDVDGQEEDDDDSKIPFMNGSLLLFTSSLDLNDLVLATCVKVDDNGLVIIIVYLKYCIIHNLHMKSCTFRSKFTSFGLSILQTLSINRSSCSRLNRFSTLCITYIVVFAVWTSVRFRYANNCFTASTTIIHPPIKRHLARDPPTINVRETMHCSCATQTQYGRQPNSSATTIVNLWQFGMRSHIVWP